MLRINIIQRWCHKIRSVAPGAGTPYTVPAPVKEVQIFSGRVGMRMRMRMRMMMMMDEWWMMNGEWWMMDDEWWMMNDEWWWTMNSIWTVNSVVSHAISKKEISPDIFNSIILNLCSPLLPQDVSRGAPRTVRGGSFRVGRRCCLGNQHLGPVVAQRSAT